MKTYGERERRAALRVPLGCEATIVPPPPLPRRKAICADISVDGLTLHTLYVPRPDEVFDVLVRPHDGPVSTGTMHVRVQVRRCQQIRGSQEYALGVKILEVIK